jgi:hypothetical protein
MSYVYGQTARGVDTPVTCTCMSFVYRQTSRGVDTPVTCTCMSFVYRQTARGVDIPATKCQILTVSLNKEHKAFRCSNCYKHHAARSSLVSSPHLTLDTCSLYCSIACKVPLQVVGFEQVIVFPVGVQHLITWGKLKASEKEDEAHCKYMKSRKGILTMSSVSSWIGR